MRTSKDMLVSDKRIDQILFDVGLTVHLAHYNRAREACRMMRKEHHKHLTKLRADLDEALGEMRRHLCILQRAQADPMVWDKLTIATGVATLNGYESVLVKHFKITG